MPQIERMGGRPSRVARPIRAVRRVVAYAIAREEIDKVRSDFDRQLEEMRGLVIESSAFTARALREVEHLLGVRTAAGRGEASADPGPRDLAVAYAMRAVNGLPPGASVLDLAPASTALGFTLASLGYRVSAVDGVDNGYRHPNLNLVDHTGDQPDAQFAAILAVLPTEADALVSARRLAQPGTRLVAAVELAAGSGSKRLSARDYKSLPGWAIEERSIAEPGPDGCWTVVEGRRRGRPAVALITARAV